MVEQAKKRIMEGIIEAREILDELNILLTKVASKNDLELLQDVILYTARMINIVNNHILVMAYKKLTGEEDD